jgi:hypothetical protein
MEQIYPTWFRHNYRICLNGQCSNFTPEKLLDTFVVHVSFLLSFTMNVRRMQLRIKDFDIMTSSRFSVLEVDDALFDEIFAL